MGVTERTRLSSFYNGNDYDVSTNPGGMADGGHRQNMIPFGQDVAVVGQDCASYAARAEAGASQTDAWKLETNAVVYVDASTIRVTGVDVTSRYMEGRALLLDQTADAYTYVASSTYTGGNTVITLATAVATSPLTALYYGQDPNNAPKAQNAKALAIIFG